jgi:hypothetical protein
MEPPYVYRLPENTHIFRATTRSKEGRWFAMTLENAHVYGTHVTEYSTTKELKLLNIMSLAFHNDFIDRLNILFPGNDYKGLDINKIKCLLPLGLYDEKAQKFGANAFNGFQLPHNVSRWDSGMELTSMNLGNRHRFSEHSLDTYMGEVMEKIYGAHFDGFISPIEWPTKVHGGSFPREMCMFKIQNIKEENTHTKETTGGTKDTYSIPIMFNMNITESMEKDMNEKIKKMIDARPPFRPLQTLDIVVPKRRNKTRKNTKPL